MPTKKLNKAKEKPKIDIRNNGLELNPNIPLKAILIEKINCTFKFLSIRHRVFRW